MSSLVENATIKIRRDSAANWTSNNPTLASGEWGIETDTRHIKIGDGSTAWNSLTYHIGGSDIKNITTASDETETLPDPADIGGTYIIGRFGAGTGKATFNAPVGITIRWPDGATTSDIVFEGSGNATIIERAGELYVQEYDESNNWINGTHLNGWTDFNASWEGLQYRRDPIKRTVQVRGSLQGSGSTNGTFIQLPVGYRPAKQSRVAILGSGINILYVDIATNGTITVSALNGADNHLGLLEISLD